LYEREDARLSTYYEHLDISAYLRRGSYYVTLALLVTNHRMPPRYAMVGTSIFCRRDSMCRLLNSISHRLIRGVTAGRIMFHLSAIKLAALSA